MAQVQDESATGTEVAGVTQQGAGGVQAVIAHWNNREWAAAATALDQLLAADKPSHGSNVIDKRLCVHLKGICASYNGQYELAKRIFEQALEHLNHVDEDVVLDHLEISSAHWLGDACLVLRQMDDAALAWSMAWESITNHQSGYEAQGERLLSSLYFLQDGSLQGDTLSRRTLGELADALDGSQKTALKTFRPMSALRKADYLSSPITQLNARIKEKPNVEIAKFGERPSDLTIDAEVFSYPDHNPDSWKFQWDHFLLLDPRKFQYIASWGLQVNYAQLDLRFWPNLHQEYQFFSKVPINSIYSTRKRSLKWLVSSLETALNTRGMLCTHHFDRMRVVRVREFGVMDYVAAFVIIFIRTPLYTILGVQVPNHLVRTSWSKVHKPEIGTRNRVVSELKAILAAAEMDSPAGDPRYVDVYPGGSKPIHVDNTATLTSPV